MLPLLIALAAAVAVVVVLSVILARMRREVSHDVKRQLQE